MQITAKHLKEILDNLPPLGLYGPSILVPLKPEVCITLPHTMVEFPVYIKLEYSNQLRDWVINLPAYS